MVRVESEKTIDKCNEGKIGRTKRKNLARKGKEEWEAQLILFCQIYTKYINLPSLFVIIKYIQLIANYLNVF